MDVIRVKDQKQWDHEIEALQKSCHFAQSWLWGDILIHEKKKVQNLVIMEQNKTVGLAQVVLLDLPLSLRYAFCPKGPIYIEEDKKEMITESLKNYLREQKCIFARIEPESIEGIKSVESIDINPRTTVVLDITDTEEEILKQMKSKTRYNIRLSQKKEMNVVNEKDVDSFYNLSKTTAKRDKFYLHPKEHYEKILQSEMSYQLSVQKDGKIITSNVFVGSGDTFTYLFGASDYDYRKLMAPYLLQWQGIILAKKLGYKKYDFFGIAPQQKDKDGNMSYDKEHRYAGVTRFKMGFGGKVVQADGTFDIIIDKKKYYIYKLLRKLRRLF